ncbi:MAG TPA: protein kinase family protein [Pseudobacteroides sp.]|uniref:protein kinase family protein n=1 Tax=Pseudobacteroides sp. TaxID=1968840 RepID=UPI002F934DCC
MSRKLSRFKSFFETLFGREKKYEPTEQVGEYTIEEILGEGRFGFCYRVSRNGSLFVLKQLKKRMLKKSGTKVRYEEDILKSLLHKGIPRFIERIELDDFYGYVLEYKEGKTFEHIIYLDQHKFTRKEIFNIGIQLLDILKYLHSAGIIHRDIRVPNTLYDGHNVNLIDFGLARLINNEKYMKDMDFAFLGDFLLHLYYSSFEYTGRKKLPWYEELALMDKELMFLKRLMGVGERYSNIHQVEDDFYNAFEDITI